MLAGSESASCGRLTMSATAIAIDRNRSEIKQFRRKLEPYTAIHSSCRTRHDAAIRIHMAALELSQFDFDRSEWEIG